MYLTSHSTSASMICNDLPSMVRLTGVPASLSDLTEDSHSSRSSPRLSATIWNPVSLTNKSNLSTTISAKYSSEFPVAATLKRCSLFPDPEFEALKPWQVALNKSMNNANVPPLDRHQTSSSNVYVEREDQQTSILHEDLISNAWRHPYPSSWLEMSTSDEGEQLDWDDEDDRSVYGNDYGSEVGPDAERGRSSTATDTNRFLPSMPLQPPNTISFRTQEIGATPIIRRTRSQTVPQHAQEVYASPLPSYSTSTSKRVEFLHLADRPRPHLNNAPLSLSRISERSEQAVEEPRESKANVQFHSNDTHGAIPQWQRFSSPSKVTFLPTLKRSSSSMRSLEHFWDQKFGRNDSENEGSSSASKYRRRDRFFRSKKRLESLQEEGVSEDAPEPVGVPPFSVDGIPSAAETAQATYIRVLDEDGTSISFGKILSGGDSADAGDKVKTIVCFIRHFLCPMCQDYMYSIGRNIDSKALERAGLRLVIVGNGGWQMIKSYRRIFKLPYAVYTDPSATLYTALGMTLRTLDPGPKMPSVSSSSSSISISPSSSSASLPDSTETRPDTYVRHKSLLSGVSLVLRNAVKARMPIWRYMGDKALLGGEFVFDKVPGKDISCVWAHRMRYTTAHEEIKSVVGEAQVSTIDVGSCSGTECSSSFMTAMSSLSRLSPSIDQASLAREMGFVDASSSDLYNTDLSLRDYESTTSRPVSSIYSTIASQTSSTSSWRKLRHKEKNRWNKMIGLLDQRLVAVGSGDVSTNPSTEGSELDYHLEVEIPEVIDDTRDEEEVFERWFSTAT